VNFHLAEEQDMLRDMLTRFLADQYPCGVGHDGAASDTLWHALAVTLGIVGAALPETAGGMGGGAVETMIVQEALGRARVIAPYLETVVLGGGILRRVPGAPARAALTGIIAGEIKIALAGAEPGASFESRAACLTARREGDGFRIDGRQAVVVGAPQADLLIVTAQIEGQAGLSNWLVDADTPEIERHDFRLIDDRPAADLRFNAVYAPANALLGDEGGALPLLEQIADEGIAALCAEAVGVMRQMLADTVDYTRQRRQFGQPLASFQVLQHRMVDMYLALEQAVSATYLATLNLDADPVTRAKAVSAAKATVGQSVRFVAQNAVQLHGAMGMTEELAIGRYFRRATVIERQFGTADQHIARYATLSRAA